MLSRWDTRKEDCVLEGDRVLIAACAVVSVVAAGMPSPASQ